jgi:hypothetical protein
MAASQWRLATIICTILLVALLVTMSSLAIVTAHDAVMLKRAVEVALGVGPGPPVVHELALPPLPPSNELHAAFARFAADLVARLEYNSTYGDLHAPAVLEQLGTFSSNSGKFNGWLLRARDTPTQLWLVFRGTSTKDEWVKDFQLRQVSFLTRLSSRAISRIAYPTLMHAPMRVDTGMFNPDIGVHSGFMDIYMSMRPLILSALQATNFTQLNITGHSMGAAQALYATLDLSTLFPNTRLDTVVFGCPRVGNSKFAEAVVSSPNVHSLVMVANTCDLVTNVPMAVQPTLSPPYTALVYTHPGSALHNFTDNREGWIANHMIGVYLDYLVQ